MNSKIRFLLTMDAFRIVAFGLLGPIYALFVEEIGGGILDAGFAFATFSIVLGVSAYFVGRLGDRLNKTLLLFGGHLLLSIGFFSYIFVKTPIHFMITQVVLGLGAAVAAPVFDALFSESLDKEKYSSEWGGWEAENFVLTGLAALAGAAIANFYGFVTLFAVMGTSSLVSLFFIYLFKRFQDGIEKKI